MPCLSCFTCIIEQQKMDLQKNYREHFYHEQNLILRREMRELDLSVAQQPESLICSSNFLLVGPPRCGKTSLLKTLQFALNGSFGWGFSMKWPITLVEIKKGPRWQIEGMQEIKQSPPKYSIQGMELSSSEPPSYRYKKSLEYVEGIMSGCTQQPNWNSGKMARVCLIMIDSMADLPPEELTYLRFLKADLAERGTKILLLLRVSGRYVGQMWRRIEMHMYELQVEFDLKREDIICLNTYCFDSKPNSSLMAINPLLQSAFRLQNDEEINFHALQLLLKIVRESELSSKYRSPKGHGWLCDWN